MNLSMCKKNIIRKESGELLKFYIQNENIYCEKMNIKSRDNMEILRNVKAYDVAIDFKDNIHLLGVTNCGKLCHCIYSGNTIKINILKSYRPLINQINKVNLFIIARKMHMIYSFEKLSDKNSKIVHSHMEGNRWKTDYIHIEASRDDRLSYMVDYNSKGDIFLIYKNLEKRPYIRVYSNSLKKWQEPLILNSNNDDMEFENMLVDSINNIHVLYRSKNDKKRLNHISKNIKNISENSCWVKYTFDKVEHKCDFKIFEFDKTIFIVWNINKTVTIQNSMMDTLKWDMKKRISLSDIQDIKYIGSKYKNMNIDKYIDSLGVIESNDIKFICIDRGVISKGDEKEIIEEEKQEITQGSIQSGTQLDVEKITKKEIAENNYFRSYYKEEEKESFIKSLKKYFNL
ncbi:hypothetical protein [Tepidibacter mesophilus]|uniref:hypothetical protein n=1 Tax=Tepidibacter mesophilus TaxID=655607 RepID=UPI000C076626|nr:hypothetical protein [Tepidibacter mesophilus]